MSAILEPIEAPLAPEQLAARWQALCNDPTFEDIAGKIELTEWGEILMSPVGKTHGIVASHIATHLKHVLGGQTMVEVGIATGLGVRAPDVAWCSEAFLQKHPEEMPLAAAPELCIEIVSASNALPKLREKAMAYINAGAIEAWIVFPQTRAIEIYGRGGRLNATAFAIDTAKLFA
jgi:Uma2 family endonuclease